VLTQQHPDAAGSWIVWSRIQYEDGNKVEAIEAIRRAIELNPMIATASAELGEMLLADGEVDEAIAAFDRAQEVDLLDARAAISAATGLIEVGRVEEAEARLRDILIRHPWHGRAALMLVELLLESDANGPAVVDEWTYQLARRAARYSGISGPRAHLVLAEIELERGDADEAVRQFERVIKAKYQIADAQFGLAKALVALDRSGDARVILEAALTLDDLTESMAALTLLEELRVEEENP
jgi:tetratricopeptide (TPR) repeat protein